VDIGLCEYAVDLTVRPGAMKQTNVDRLCELGLTDEQITVATQVISYFNYINRIADGLGVDLEDWMTLSKEEWLSQKPNWQ
jgi:uncharacterized protein YciW